MADIISVPAKVLRQKSTNVDSFDEALRDELHELISALQNATDPQGVGLSFPQIGVSRRAFVTYLEHKIRIFVNPKLLDQDEKMTLGGTPERPTLEGCLSIPHLYGPVWRPKKIKIQAQDEFGREFTKTFSSFPARLFLHELDHLDGVLFTDYTVRDTLPLYFLDPVKEQMVPIQDISQTIRW